MVVVAGGSARMIVTMLTRGRCRSVHTMVLTIETIIVLWDGADRVSWGEDA